MYIDTGRLGLKRSPREISPGVLVLEAPALALSASAHAYFSPTCVSRKLARSCLHTDTHTHTHTRSRIYSFAWEEERPSEYIPTSKTRETVLRMRPRGRQYETRTRYPFSLVYSSIASRSFSFFLLKISSLSFHLSCHCHAQGRERSFLFQIIV